MQNGNIKFGVKVTLLHTQQGAAEASLKRTGAVPAHRWLVPLFCQNTGKEPRSESVGASS